MAIEEGDEQNNLASKSSIIGTNKDDQSPEGAGGSSIAADMKNLLGYLNQSEWIYSLNIGNIMQVAPLTLPDFLSTNSLSVELTREYVLEKICFLCVSYFCLGTEFRFLH